MVWIPFSGGVRSRVPYGNNFKYAHKYMLVLAMKRMLIRFVRSIWCRGWTGLDSLTTSCLCEAPEGIGRIGCDRRERSAVGIVARNVTKKPLVKGWDFQDMTKWDNFEFQILVGTLQAWWPILKFGCTKIKGPKHITLLRKVLVKMFYLGKVKQADFLIYSGSKFTAKCTLSDALETLQHRTTWLNFYILPPK